MNFIKLDDKCDTHTIFTNRIGIKVYRYIYDDFPERMKKQILSKMASKIHETNIHK